jgi:hypothetical protein
MQYVEFIVTRPTTGAALPGAKVTVYLAGTTTPATLYNAAGGGISNPATADASGLIGFAAANGSYDFSAASADGSYVVPTIHRQQFYDLSGLDAQVTLAQAAAAAAAAAAPFLVVSATSLAGALANTTSGQQAAVQQSQGYATDLYVRSTTGLQYLSTTPTGLGVLTTQRIANLGFSQFATQAPSTSLVFGQAILAKFTDGRLTPPAPTSPISHNLYAGFDQANDGGSGATITRNYTTIGGKTYHRVQLSASGHLAYIAAIPAGSSTITLYARSNTGAGNQNCTIAKDGDAASRALTEGADTLVSFTASATTVRWAWVYNFGGALPLDILIRDDIQIYAYEDAPATEPSRQYVFRQELNGAYGAAVLSAPIITDSNMFVAPQRLRMDMTTSQSRPTSPPSFAALSAAIGIRDDGSTVASGGVFYTPNAYGNTTYYSFNFSIEGQKMGASIPGLSYYTFASMAGKGTIIVSAGFDATSSWIRFNGVTVATGPGGTPLSFPYMLMGGAGYGGSAPMVGAHSAPLLSNVKWSDVEATQATLAVRDSLTAHGATVPSQWFYAALGDSITFIYGVATPYSKSAPVAADVPFVTITGVPGATIAGAGGSNSIITDQLPGVVKSAQQAKANGQKYIASLFIGANGLPTIDQLRTVWAAIRAAGGKVIACTVIAGGNGSFTDAQRLAINTAIRADSANYDALADFGALPHLGNFAYTTDPIWFDAGAGLHPTQKGHDDELKPSMLAALLAVKAL